MAFCAEMSNKVRKLNNLGALFLLGVLDLIYLCPFVLPCVLSVIFVCVSI